MAFDRGVARGIGEYIRSNTGWIILMDHMLEASMKGLQHWKPDGIITSIHLPAIEEVSKLKDIDIVGFGSYSPEADGHLKFPIVTSDQHEIGRQAAQHFMNNGMKNFAFCGGDENALWCKQRQEGFVDELKKHDHSCHIYEPDFVSVTSMPEAVNSLGRWLGSLPKPTGVFVFFDGWARWILDACVVEKINVPQEVSVLGVDNDRWLCELSQPMLSSIDVNVRKAGYTAAELLNAMMNGEPKPQDLTYIAPAGVISRDSSSFMDFKDPEVAFAMRYIKEHACDPITPADVLKVTGMSNSTAYRKFMKAIGRSIHNEIQRTQLDRIKELLTTTNMNVNAIAQSSGFENVRYLTQVFRDLTGQTPTEYRRKQSTPKI
jgi:LacI family transcriptional regulator